MGIGAHLGVPCQRLDRAGVKYRLSPTDARGRDLGPLVEVHVVDSLGVSHPFVADKSGHIEVDPDFQEVVSQLVAAGFEAAQPTKSQPEG